mgnify:CR=1 FL=1
MIIALPILQVIIFGYAIRTDVDHVRLAIVDPAPDAGDAGDPRAGSARRGVFEIVARRAADRDARGRCFAAAPRRARSLFEAGFAERLARGLPAGLLHHRRRHRSRTPGASSRPMPRPWCRVIEQERACRRSGVVRIVPSVRMRFNPTRESSNLFVPGLMAFVLTIISSLMTAISLTREKETGTMEALLVSPLRPWQIIVGKVAPYLVVGFASVVGVILEARLVFHVPLRGSLVPAARSKGCCSSSVSLSLGILISARTSSQRVAMMGALVGTMLPTMLLSGFIFPIESMPWPLQAISIVVPARWFVSGRAQHHAERRRAGLSVAADARAARRWRSSC